MKGSSSLVWVWHEKGSPFETTTSVIDNPAQYESPLLNSETKAPPHYAPGCLPGSPTTSSFSDAVDLLGQVRCAKRRLGSVRNFDVGHTYYTFKSRAWHGLPRTMDSIDRFAMDLPNALSTWMQSLAFTSDVRKTTTAGTIDDFTYQHLSGN